MNRAGRLAGRTAAITGAASGIGWATANRFLEEGAVVIAVDRDPIPQPSSAATGEHPNYFALSADVSTEAGRKQILEQVSSVGKLNIVVQCAAVSAPGTALTIERANWDRVIDVNLTSVMEINKLLLPILRAGEGGSIVLVGSQLGLVGTKNSLAYTASKGALVNLARSMALELAQDSIRVNCLCPGTTDTPFLHRSVERSTDPQRSRSETLSRVPLGRFAAASEIANAALFLASSESSYVTGTSLVVDGGYTSW